MSVYTTLLPIKFNFTNSTKPIISAPYMGAAEYEFGAPQKTYAVIREASLDQLARVVHASSEGTTYTAICLKKDVEQVKAILVGMVDNTLVNKGGDWKTSYELRENEQYECWLSMKPQAIITKAGTGMLRWMFHYARRMYNKDNLNMSIGDTFLAIDKHANLRPAKVIGIPVDDAMVTVKLNEKVTKKVPVWVLITGELGLKDIEVADETT